MDTDVSTLLRIAKPAYVPPAQPLHQSQHQHMPFWMQTAHARTETSEGQSFIALLTEEEESLS